MRLETWLPALVFLIAVAGAWAEEGSERLGPSIIGIDHMPTAVKDLDQATAVFSQLGFSIKRGRFHEDGIHNNHIKFRDGSGIELLAPPTESKDKLTGQYLEFLRNGDGPAYISFHAREKGKLITALRSSHIKFKDGGTISLDDPLLSFIFFDQDNRSPTDKPEHFAHPNSALAMSGVWLALDNASRKHLAKVLVALGAVESRGEVLAQDPIVAEIFTIQNGRVVIFPKNYQLQKDRPVIGAEFLVQDAETASKFLSNAHGSQRISAGSQSFLVPPSAAHGLWLEFHVRHDA